MKEIYRIEIQDGENTYCEYITNKKDADCFSDFTRDVKDIITIKVTDEEYEILKKLRIIVGE
jgi:hypothetical protein